MVHPSCVQTPSIAVNALALVRDNRNTPAVDSTSTAPPTSAKADPSTMTRTALPANWPVLFPRGDAMLLGEVGDDAPELPPHAVNSVASVPPEATWHAPPQKRRREIDVSASDICRIACAKSRPIENRRVFRRERNLSVPEMTDWAVHR
jgi:hypothetical protein